NSGASVWSKDRQKSSRMPLLNIVIVAQERETMKLTEVLGPRLERGQAGILLVEALVGIAILGLVAFGFTNMIVHSLHAQKHTELRVDLTNIKRQLSESVDCQQTATNLCGTWPCTASQLQTFCDGRPITVFDKKGRAIISAAS